MWRSPATSYLVGRTLNSIYKSAEKIQISNQIIGKAMSMSSLEGQRTNQSVDQYPERNAASTRNFRIGENVPRKDKINFLVNTLLDLKNSKEDVYGTLDAWVAWEQNFPVGSLKKALLALEKEQQWHRVVQVIKWMLSKGQGSTMGTCGQLIRALDMDHRAEEAHKFWEKRIGIDLHSVPWQLCKSMIAIYYRNNMLERLIKLFKGLEAFDRKPPEKSIVQRVADAYEVLGLLEEKERVLEKYKDLFTEKEKRSNKKSKSSSMKGKKKKGRIRDTPVSDGVTNAIEDIQ
ncbi:pentatricopeptide repeat-containing protein At4g18975, chloroplastic isoform X1 [Citrus clementina]|uniref:pentatricopeptide repeat-containing protein At4g18975, chloroplastic isoform X1 n=1 Tax=Citrus clementina TaxID=85681 RepID=UPI0003D7309E|nr:pentatricopeptide repeat-containing protein At4g18975, chloroplastic isoform X1 [Citrus x clementina]